MFLTYQSMYPRCISNFDLKDITNLVIEFQEKADRARKNQIYATLFCNLFPMMLDISKKYHSFSNEEKVETCMYMLLRMMNMYKKENKIKFTTYFYQGLDNDFKTQINSRLTNKRKIWQNVIQNEDTYQKAVIKLSKKPQPETDLDLIKKIQENDNLSSLEKDYCVCVLSGYTKSKDIAEKLQPAKNLKNMCMDNPLYDKTNVNLTNKIRLKLRKRFMSNKYDLIN